MTFAVKIVLSEKNVSALCKLNWTRMPMQLGDQMSPGGLHFEKLSQRNIFLDL